MKLIFLDVDGVLITGMPPFDWRTPDPKCINYLNVLTDETKAKIVISSCWRVGRDTAELQTLLASWGVTGEIIGRTGGMQDRRGYEIGEWLQAFPDEVEAFVIIDDDADMEGLISKLVQTRPHIGLSEDDIQKAKEALNF